MALDAKTKAALDKSYGNPPKCQKCGNNTNVVTLVHGKPSSDLLEYYQKYGKVKLAGCRRDPKNKVKYECTQCSAKF